MRRALRLLLVGTSVAVVAGVLLQAFSIAAYVRGAGGGSLDLHETGGVVTHALEIVALVVAIPLWWGVWRLLALAAALPVLGTLQVIAIGLRAFFAHERVELVHVAHDFLARHLDAVAPVVEPEVEPSGRHRSER